MDEAKSIENLTKLVTKGYYNRNLTILYFLKNITNSGSSCALSLNSHYITFPDTRGMLVSLENWHIK